MPGVGKGGGWGVAGLWLIIAYFLQLKLHPAPPIITIFFLLKRNHKKTTLKTARFGKVG